VWQRLWDDHDRAFRMLAVAQDVQGAERVAPIAEAAGVSFPVLLDPAGEIARALGLQMVPAGCFVDADGVLRYRHADGFDVADPRVRANLAAFLEGRPLEDADAAETMDPGALQLFAEGVSAYAAGREQEGLRLWRAALELDPDNFLIRSQIWTAEHPERFWPVVDREWQELQLMKEGYDKPLP
jgi:hypothetical protein